MHHYCTIFAFFNPGRGPFFLHFFTGDREVLRQFLRANRYSSGIRNLRCINHFEIASHLSRVRGAQHFGACGAQAGRDLIEITRAVRQLGLTQEEAGRRMGVPQPKVSGMMRGDFSNLSERKLMECLNRLGYDIEIKVRPAAQAIGRVTMEIA